MTKKLKQRSIPWAGGVVYRWYEYDKIILIDEHLLMAKICEWGVIER